MSKFIGTAEEFETFIGPYTSKIITKLGKQLKSKHQKSCQNDKLGKHTKNNEYCGIYKRLDAAHYSHKKCGSRREIIKNIIQQYKSSNNVFEIDIESFITAFTNAHHPIEEHIIMLCRPHHSAYDTFNKVKPDENREDTAVDDDTIETAPTLLKADKLAIGKLKTHIATNVPYLKNSNYSIASLYNDKWNFNISKHSEKGYLLCYNQYEHDLSIVEYNWTKEDLKHLANNLKKDKTKYSINIPLSQTEFIDSKSKLNFRLKDYYRL